MREAGTADATDTAATLLAWSSLPRGYRVAVLGASCGAALAGALATAALNNTEPKDGPSG